MVSMHLRYITWAVCVLTIYSGFTFKYISFDFLRPLIKKFIRKRFVFGAFIGLFLSLWISRSLYSQSAIVKEQKYYSRFSERIRKEPGLAILADHGPGAKIANFYEATAFYARGETFYLPYDGNKISAQETLGYLNQNDVDYIVAVRYGAYKHVGLEPFYNPDSKIHGWKPLYKDPENNADISIIVWKKV